MKSNRIFMLAWIFTVIALMGIQEGMANPGNHLPITSLTTEWQLDREVDGIQIYAKRVECHDHMNGIFKEFVMLKFVNTTSQNLRLNWEMELWYDGKCLTCGLASQEYHYSLDLEAGSSLEGSCDKQSPREVKLHLRLLNYAHVPKLTQYNLANLQVSLR